MTPVRIGCVRYLNTLPLIEGLRTWESAGGCELITAVPSALIGKLLNNEVDIALCSIIDSASSAQSALTAPSVLPVGMIGCDGPTLTVRVFSKTPIADVSEFTVDSDSHTSVALLRVLMWKLHGKKITVRERTFDPASPSCPRASVPPCLPDSLLLIGDKVVTDAPSERDYPHTLDLGAAWKQLTGLPFVYAVWMCRAGEENSLPVRAASAMLDRTRRHNATRLDWIVASRASEKGWPADLAAAYLGSALTYAVNEPEREAAEKFLRWAAELGIGSGTIRWAGE